MRCWLLLLSISVLGKASPVHHQQDQTVLGNEPLSLSASRLLRYRNNAATLKQLEASGADIWKVTADYILARMTPPFGDPVHDDYEEILSDLDGSKLLEIDTYSAENPDYDIHSSYHNLDSLELILRLFALDYAQYATLIPVAQSAENRTIYGMKLSKTDQQDPSPNKKLGVVVLGGQHAREYISTSTVLYMLHTLLMAASLPADINAPRVNSILDEFEFTFIPIVNVDGYDYTWTTDRLWRKTRQQVLPVADNDDNSDMCRGIDLNRNWGAHFVPPYRPNYCTESYSGKEAFEAVELQGIRDYILNTTNNIQVFLDLHSFGQMLMFPYAYNCDDEPPNLENLYEAVIGATSSARTVHGRLYQSGPVCDLSYLSNGDAVDWAYEQGIKWSFSAELRDLGTHGFLLPPSQIRATGEEILEMFLSLATFIAMKEEGKRDPK